MRIERIKTYTQKQYVDLGKSYAIQELRDIIFINYDKVHWSTSVIEIEKTSRGVNFKGETVKIEPTVCIKLSVEVD